MNKKGFTLIELLAVIAILTILVVVAVPNVMKMYGNAKLNSFINQAQNVYKAANNQIMLNELENTVSTNFCYATGESNNPIKLSGNKNVYYLIETENNKIVKLKISTEEYSVNLENAQGIDITDIKKSEINGKGDLNYILLGNCEVSILPPGYVLATTDDFLVETDYYYDENYNEIEFQYFRYIGSAEYVAVPHVIQGTPVTSYHKMFYRTSVKGVYSDNPNIVDMSYMFAENYATTLDLNNFDTSKVTDMANMFFGNQAITLNLRSFDTSKVINMQAMFQQSQATALDLSNFNTSSVKDMTYMFYGSQATALDLNNFDTSNVYYMYYMFYNSKAITLDLSSFNTSNIMNMTYMFYGSQATTLDLSSFDTSKVTDMNYMFWNSQTTTGYARTQADANKFNASTSKPTGLTFVIKP